MTIKKLKEKLNKFPENMEVMLSSDEEGNEFNDLYDLGDEYCGNDGQIYSEEDFKELDKIEQQEMKKVLVLWP